jgi:hypothetical protein
MKEIIKIIENWESLNLDEKNKAQNQLLEKNIIKQQFFNYESSKFFKENGFVKLENFISKELSNFMYDYIKLSAKRLLHLFNEEIPHDSDVYGSFGDTQAPGDYSKYGDMLFDTLLAKGVETIKYTICTDVIPTYTYHRLYTKGTELKRHIDRPSCEISTTLFLGHNIDNLKNEKNYNWPMYVFSKKENKEVPIYLNSGDMIIYRGCEIEHWREPYRGLNHAQVFLHYNEVNGQYNIKYDGRPELGLPSSFRKILNLNENKKEDLLDYDKKVDLKKINYVI